MIKYRYTYRWEGFIMATMQCPKCKSTDIEVLGQKKKGFSVGKAFGGALLTGGIGTLARICWWKRKI